MNKEFDSAYPVHLNGIIHPDEFEESINNINRVINLKNTSVRHWMTFYSLFLAASIVFMIVGIVLVIKSNVAYIALASIGFGLFCSMPFVLMYPATKINKYRKEQLPEAIAKESMKYSSRLPIPCNWRLDFSIDPTVDSEYAQEIYMVSTTLSLTYFS